jgi:hypothetical protein
MIYISIFFVSWSLVAIYCLYKEGKDNKKHILIWSICLIVWGLNLIHAIIKAV